MSTYLPIQCYVEKVSIPPPEGSPEKTPPTHGLCATCTRCGHKATVEGGAAKSKRLALATLHEECPRGEGNKYRDRIIPRGVSVWFPHLGKLYPVEVSRFTACTAAGPVLKTTPIIVTFEAKKYRQAAEAFFRKLKRKYSNTTIQQPAQAVAS